MCLMVVDACVSVLCVCGSLWVGHACELAGYVKEKKADDTHAVDKKKDQAEVLSARERYLARKQSKMQKTATSGT